MRISFSVTDFATFLIIKLTFDSKVKMRGIMTRRVTHHFLRELNWTNNLSWLRKSQIFASFSTKNMEFILYVNELCSYFYQRALTWSQCFKNGFLKGFHQEKYVEKCTVHSGPQPVGVQKPQNPFFKAVMFLLEMQVKRNRVKAKFEKIFEPLKYFSNPISSKELSMHE